MVGLSLKLDLQKRWVILMKNKKNKNEESSENNIDIDKMNDADNEADNEADKEEKSLEIEKELDFESALNELEKIVDDLEKGGLSLDKTVEDFSQGMKLLKFCHQKLDKAEKKIELMLKEDDEFTEAVPFDREEKVDQ